MSVFSLAFNVITHMNYAIPIKIKASLIDLKNMNREGMRNSKDFLKSVCQEATVEI